MKTRTTIRKIALLTSGGDAPGLNACIRAVVKTAALHGVEVAGIQHGFDGMIAGDFIPLNTSAVHHIIQTGGTILRSSRSEAFKTKKGRKKAYEQLREAGIDAVILIGGDGSFRGAQAFLKEFAIPLIGIPKTIDNDISGTDTCIGFDTALNTAMQAIDRIRDTAESHERVFIVEVMGRDSGYIAYGAGLAGGAEAILIPETKADFRQLEKLLKKGRGKNPSSLIIVVAEGDERGNAATISEIVKQHLPGHSIGLCVLGHTQRGGSPTAADRILASEMGYEAVLALLAGKSNSIIGRQNNRVMHVPLRLVKQQRLQLTKNKFNFLTALTE